MKKKSLLLLFLFASFLKQQEIFAKSSLPENKKYYISANFGGFFPLRESFQDLKVSKEARVFLSRSMSYSAKAGYLFAPDCYLGASFGHRPKYDLTVELNHPLLGELKGESAVSTSSFMANLSYDFIKKGNATPFFEVGFGVANIKIKELKIAIPGLALMDAKNQDYYVFTSKLGIGSSFSINENVSLELVMSIETDYNLRLEYKDHENKDKKFKKNISAGELAAGIRINL